MVYPAPAVMVSCGDGEEKYNIITIAWTGTINSKPPMAFISVRKERHSHKLIQEAGGFVINLTNEALTHATDYCGVKSGKDVDKFKHLELTPIPATIVKAPMIKEAPVNIECQITQVIELGSHDMFMAEVVAIHVDENLMDEQGKLHLEWSKPIVYSHGEYYGMGELLGRFGYSIMKKKTLQKIEKEKAVEKRAQEKKAIREEKKQKKEVAREAWEKNQKEWLESKDRKQKRKEGYIEKAKADGTYMKRVKAERAQEKKETGPKKFYENRPDKKGRRHD